MAKYSKIWTIIKHEYLTRLKTKSFLLSTLLGPLGMLLLIVIPGVVAYFSMDAPSKKLAIFDETSYIGQKLVEKDSSRYYLVSKSQSQLDNEVILGKIDGYVKIDKDFAETGNAHVFTKGGGGIAYINDVENKLDRILLEKRLDAYPEKEKIMDIMHQDVNIAKHKLTDAGETETDFTEAYAVLGYFLGFLIYMMMFMYGMFVMRGVIEEKANRIVEILASSARPFEIMMGKVLGIGAIGLTQMLIWITIGGILLVFGVPMVSMMFQPDLAAGAMAGQGANAQVGGFEMPTISFGVVIALIYFFLIGYFIYSTLFAAVGSAVDQEQDAQQLVLPITLPLIIPIMLIYSVVANPDGTLAVVLSLIPYFTPIIMIVRIAATSVPAWQIILSVVLTMGTFILNLYIASKIYSIGIMMYGSKPSFKDIIRWFRMAK